MTPTSARLAVATAAVALAGACTVQNSEAARGTEAGASAAAAEAPQPSSILVRSAPADGATLSKSPENLQLVFSRPARLIEVIVEGSDGSAMPMMVTAAAETESYSIPLQALDPGSYSVRWRAESGGQSHSGTIRFTLR